MFSLKSRAALGALTIVAAGLPTAQALAGQSQTSLASANDIKIEKAYAYFDSFPPTNRKLAVFVVKTSGQMPRRFDGLIRAGGRIDGNVGGGSVGSVGGRSSRCYTFTAVVRDGHFVTRDNGVGKKAATGSTHKVSLSATGPDGKDVSSSVSVKLRARKAGDRTGKPLGC